MTWWPTKSPWHGQKSARQASTTPSDSGETLRASGRRSCKKSDQRSERRLRRQLLNQSFTESG